MFRLFKQLVGSLGVDSFLLVLLEYSIGVVVVVLSDGVCSDCSLFWLSFSIVYHMFSEYCSGCCIAVFKVQFGLQLVFKVFKDKKGLLLEDCMSLYACVLSVHVV